MDSSFDDSRGSHCIDIGYASNRNTHRESKNLGISLPRLLRYTKEPHWLEVLQDSSQVLPFLSPAGMGKCLYIDPERTARHAGSLVTGNIIEAMRSAHAGMNVPLDIHCDVHNCTIPNFAPVGVVSRTVVVDNKRYRAALISYSRRSISDHLARAKNHTPTIRAVVEFVGRLPKTRTLLSSALLVENLLKHPLETTQVFGGLLKSGCRVSRSPPHLDKCVFSIIIRSLHPSTPEPIRAFKEPVLRSLV